jgi:hypothetical protein
MEFVFQPSPSRWAGLRGACARMTLPFRNSRRGLLRRQPARPAAVAHEQAASTRGSHLDWKDAAREADARVLGAQSLAALHAMASDRVDAAEYALNRLLQECAAVMSLPVAPAVAPAGELLSEQPLSASTRLAA